MSQHFLDEALLEALRGQFLFQVERMMTLDLLVAERPFVRILFPLLAVPL